METRPTPPPQGNPLAVVSLLLVLVTILLFYLLNYYMDHFARRYESPSNMWLLLIVLVILGILLGHAAVKRSKVIPKGFGSRVIARAALTFGYFFFIIGVLFPHGDHRPQEKADMAKAINNCKQIITTLKLYAADHEAKYPDLKLPDARTSNEVFRELFKADVADSESIFGSPSSGDGKPDGNIGEKPDFKEAVQPGENHWAMTKGLTDADPGNTPLVYESPADATWPPKWNPDFAGTTKPGRTWSGGRVVIGFNDGSVSALPLESTKGQHVGLRPHPDGTPIFPTLLGRKLEVLDVAR